MSKLQEAFAALREASVKEQKIPIDFGDWLNLLKEIDWILKVQQDVYDAFGPKLNEFLKLWTQFVEEKQIDNNPDDIKTAKLVLGMIRAETASKLKIVK